MRKIIIGALAGVMCLTGCWDRVEIENRAFAVAMAIDRNEEEDGKYEVTLAVPVTETKDGEASKAALHNGSGGTLREAFQSLDVQTGKKIYLGQAKLIVLGESLTQDADLMAGAMNALEQHPDIDSQIRIVAAKGSGASALAPHPKDESLPGLFISEFYKDKKKSRGQTFKLDFEKLKGLLRTGGVVIPRLAESEDENEVPVPSGAVVIRNFQKVGEMDANETRGLLWCASRQCENAYVYAAELEASGVPLKVEKHQTALTFEENQNRLRLKLEVEVTGSVEGEANPEDYANTIAEEILSTAERMRTEWRTDGYGWRNALRKKSPLLYKKYGQDWERAYLEMEILPMIKVTMHEI